MRMVSGRLRRINGEPVYGDAVFRPSEKRAYRNERGRVLVETGLLRTDEAFVFICPMCGHKLRQHQRFAPACDGVDEKHELEPMVLLA